MTQNFNIDDLLNDDDMPDVKLTKKELEEFGGDFGPSDELHCMNDVCSKVLDIDPKSPLAEEIRENVPEESGYVVALFCRDCANS